MKSPTLRHFLAVFRVGTAIGAVLAMVVVTAIWIRSYWFTDSFERIYSTSEITRLTVYRGNAILSLEHGYRGEYNRIMSGGTLEPGWLHHEERIDPDSRPSFGEVLEASYGWRHGGFNWIPKHSLYGCPLWFVEAILLLVAAGCVAPWYKRFRAGRFSRKQTGQVQVQP